jgi:hypothetical protein
MCTRRGRAATAILLLLSAGLVVVFRSLHLSKKKSSLREWVLDFSLSLSEEAFADQKMDTLKMAVFIFHRPPSLSSPSSFLQLVTVTFSWTIIGVSNA